MTRLAAPQVLVAEDDGLASHVQNGYTARAGQMGRDEQARWVASLTPLWIDGMIGHAAR
jgi:hypothetical protein